MSGTSQQSTLSDALQNAGIATPDITALESEWSKSDPQEFVAGLSWVARCYLERQVLTTGQPTDEPWSRIAAALAGIASGDIEDAILAQIATFPPILHTSLYNAIASRSGMILAEQARQASKTASRKITSDYLLSILADGGYTFRLNELDDSIEVNGVRIDDITRNQVRVFLRDQGLGRYLTYAEEAWVADAEQHGYHPVKEYLDGLGYDGGQHIAVLADHFVDKHSIFPLLLRRWLIGAVARAYTGCQNAVLTLDGPQGIGKSEFVRWLAPRPAFYTESGIDPDSKDDQIRVATRWIWEVSELGSTTLRRDREALKHFLSTETVTVRVPYGRYDITKPALANFIATANNSAGILDDPSGNRRFWPTTLVSIDWNYKQNVNRDLVWAEANAAYLTDEAWRLTPTEQQTVAQIAEGYEVEDAVENLLRKHFTIVPNEPWRWMASADIASRLQGFGLTGPARSTQMQVSAALKHMGCQSGKHGDIRGWEGIDV